MHEQALSWRDDAVVLAVHQQEGRMEDPTWATGLASGGGGLPM
jgi:hypothetical protein